MDQTTPGYDGELKRPKPRARAGDLVAAALRNSDEGLPLSTGDLARVMGVSDDTIRREIELGVIPMAACERRSHGRGARYRIPHHVARAYLQRIGFFR